MPTAFSFAWVTRRWRREVILGDDGVIEGARPGTVVADASTISPSESRKIGQALQAKGVDFLDAPCTGSTPGAEGGTLTFMVGGDQAVFEKTKPFFEPMGKRLYYCGGPGMGLQAKLTQNLILSNIADGVQRRHGAGHQGRRRPQTDARHPGQQRRQVAA